MSARRAHKAASYTARTENVLKVKTKRTRHRASTEHSLTFRVRIMLSYREVEASLLVGWSLTSLLSTNTAISETKASYYNYGSRYVAIATQPMH